MTPDEVKKIIREELANFIGSDRYLFQKHLQLFDGRNIQTGRKTGTKFPQKSDQLLGLWGTTPVNQPEAVSDPSISTVSGSGADATINTNFTKLDNAVKAILDRLQETGIIKT